MGIENREYMSNGPQFSSARPGGWSGVKILIVLNIIIFLLQVIFPNTLEQAFALITQSVLQGQIWRLTTYDFLHDTSANLPLHLLFNMWLLWLAGTQVEAALGRREFLIFYLVAGVLSGISFMGWSLFTGTGGVAIGASGAAVAVMIVYAMYWPQVRWYLYGIIPVPVGVLALIAAATDIIPMLMELRGGGKGQIAHSAHVGGMIFGCLYARYGWRLSSWIFDSKTGALRFRNPLKRHPQLRVHTPEAEGSSEIEHTIPASVEERLDALLEKITRHGEGSLTQEERNFLSEASRRYRDRR